MELLLQGVNEARATLKALKAEADIFNNVSLVAQLVAKLSDARQERWHQDWTATEVVTSQGMLGLQF